MKFGTLTNSNIVNSMVVFTFSVLDQKYLFRGKLVQKIKLLKFLAEIWYQGQVDCVEFDGDVHFSCFFLEVLFLDEFSPKNQNCLLKLKFGA